MLKIRKLETVQNSEVMFDKFLVVRIFIMVEIRARLHH